MTFREANKNSKELFCRNNLTYDDTVERLEKYFDEEETFRIMNSACSLISWTDGHIAVICTDNYRRKFTIVAPGIYSKLIEP